MHITGAHLPARGGCQRAPARDALKRGQDRATVAALAPGGPPPYLPAYLPTYLPTCLLAYLHSHLKVHRRLSLIALIVTSYILML
mgnify:CR=1 FL=1